MDKVLQTNDSTHNERDLRRIVVDKARASQQRVVWEVKDSHKQGGWAAVRSNDLVLRLLALAPGTSMANQSGKWQYRIRKVNAGQAVYRNRSTNKAREMRLRMRDRHEMDPNWTSSASTNNQNYFGAPVVQAQAQTQAQMQPALWSFRSLLRRAASRAAQSNNTAQLGVVKLDPNEKESDMERPGASGSNNPPT